MTDHFKRQPASAESNTLDCAKHGPYEAHLLYRNRWSACPTCAGEEAAEAERLAAKEREAELRAKLAQVVQESGLIGRYLEATFDTFRPTTPAQRQVLAECRAFVTNMRPGESWPGLWLLGHPGTGKTHLCAAMVSACIWERRLRAKYVTARGLIQRVRATWHRDAEEREQDVLHDLAQAPLLVLDELGVGFGSDAELTQLFDVIDTRYQLRNPVVIASNCTGPQLRTVLGERLYDRLREGALALTFGWQSAR